MSTSFELDEVDHLTTGTIGPPGQRVFYLQAAQGDQLVSLRLEKTLVAALVRYLGALLADLPPAGPLPTDLGLREPVVAEWVVGGLGASYDEQADRVVLLAEELVEAEPVGDEPWSRRSTKAPSPASARRASRWRRSPCTAQPSSRPADRPAPCAGSHSTRKDTCAPA